MQIPQISDEVMFIALFLWITIFILVVLLVAVFAIFVSENRQKERITFPSLVKIFGGVFRRAKPKEELVSPSPAPDKGTRIIVRSHPLTGSRYTQSM